MRAYELKKLKPDLLNETQLYQAYIRVVPFGMRQFAFDMLLELKGRPDREGFALQSGCDIPANAKLENVQAMVAAALETKA